MTKLNDVHELQKARLRDTLLRARREERVPPKLRQTLLAMTATSMSPTPSVTATTAGPTAAMPRRSLMSWKLAGVAMLGALAATTFDAAPSPTAEPVSKSDQTAAGVREDLSRAGRETLHEVEPSPEPRPQAPIESPPLSVNNLPSARSNAAAPPKTANAANAANVQSKPGRPAPPATASGDMRIAEQIRIVAASRTAIHAGLPMEALDWLDMYDTEFPEGALHEEALVLRIESFVRLGRRREATERANDFLKSHPNSPYAARVRDSVSSAAAESDEPR